MSASPPAHVASRLRALRYDEHSVVLGVGAHDPQLVGPLAPTTVQTVLGSGALTASQWASAFSRVDSQAARLLREAVAHALPADTIDLTYRIDSEGEGPVTTAVDDLLTALGATAVSERPDLALLIGAPGLGGGSDAAARLLVEIGPDQVVVGPLLRPDAGPCADCLHERRRQLDPSWPLLHSQLRGLAICDGEPSTATELVSVAAGLVGIVARGWAGNHPLPAGAAMSIATPDGRLRQHLWPVHPLCDCQLTRASA